MSTTTAVIEGENYTYERTLNSVSTQMLPERSAFGVTDVTYPHYTPYWLGVTDLYSTTTIGSTVSAIAAVIMAYTPILSATATTIASVVISAITGYGNTVYFRTDRFYAMLENGPGLPTIWYNKFVTYTYSDSGRTLRITGSDRVIYEADTILV